MSWRNAEATANWSLALGAVLVVALGFCAAAVDALGDRVEQLETRPEVWTTPCECRPKGVVR